MKPFIRIASIASMIAGIVCTTTSCESESVSPAPAANEVSSKITQKLINLGVNPANAAITNTITPDGATTEIVSAGEVMIPSDQLFEYPDLEISEGQTRAFRHVNLVDVGESRNIKIVARFLEPESITGLNSAIFQYNRLGLKLTFSLVEGAEDGDVIVYRNNNELFEGVMRSFLPYQGNPGGAIELSQEVSNFSAQFRSLLFTRQLGRIIGLRSSDWRTRRSCGESATIVDSSVIHIPGTDNSGDSTASIMTECVTSTLALTDDDKKGLRFLYGTPSFNTCEPNPVRCDQSKPWKYYFCGQCFESPQQAIDNGCQEANNCGNQGQCAPNAQACDQSKPWKFFFCGQCFESAQQASDNGCAEATSCLKS